MRLAANLIKHVNIQNIISVSYSWKKPKSETKVRPYFVSYISVVGGGGHAKISKTFTQFDKSNGWKLSLLFWAYSGPVPGSKVKYNRKIYTF